MELELEARMNISKARHTAEFLRTKYSDPTLPPRKRDFIKQDIDALEFLLKYAQEALAERGIKV